MGMVSEFNIWMLRSLLWSSTMKRGFFCVCVCFFGGVTQVVAQGLLSHNETKEVSLMRTITNHPMDSLQDIIAIYRGQRERILP